MAPPDGTAGARKTFLVEGIEDLVASLGAA